MVCTTRMNPGGCYQKQRVDTQDANKGQKLKKVFLVPFSHTIIDPAQLYINL